MVAELGASAGKLDYGETQVHHTAIVEKGAYLGLGVKIGPYAIVGDKVTLGDGVEVKSHAIIQNRTIIGARTRIYSCATIGTVPQDLKYDGEDSELVCGVDNQIREYCNISLGTVEGSGKTRLGDRNLVMAYSHIAHDCLIGDSNILANGATLGGHIKIGDRAVIGGNVSVHQFVHIGDFAMLGGGSVVIQDVPPYILVQGNHAKPYGLNVVGLRRAGFSKAALKDIKSMYRILYRGSLPFKQAIEKIEAELPHSVHRDKFLNFLQTSERGVCR